MKRYTKLIYALGCALTCVSLAHAAIPNTDDPTTFLGPTLKARVTNTASNNMAYSVLGEAGAKNLRLGGTWGWQFDNSQFFKVSADYLTQDITYAFFSGNTSEWVNQGSIGAGYLYDFGQYQYDPEFNINAYLSHAPSKTLSAVTGVYTNQVGVPQGFTNYRRIAGSNAGGLSPAISIAPWMGGRVGFELNYDNVRYDKNYSPSEDAVGLGGTVKLTQAVADNVTLDLSAAIRKPFNNYEAQVNWNNIPYHGMWTVGAFGDYTVGKTTLPDTYNVGITLGYSLDRPVAQNTRTAVRTNLHSFTATPAVYLPQVLAVVDQRVVLPLAPVCSPVPTLIGTIPTMDDSISTTFNAASVFSPSSGLTYSISYTPDPSPPGSITINPTTGVITIAGGATDETITAVVTATNGCGSVSSNTFTIELHD